MRLEFILLITICFLLDYTTSKPPTLTPKEKSAVDKLRNAVGRKLTAKYMKSDAYLIKWLKAKSFDHRQAVEALEKTLEWRKEVNADSLPFEDYSDLKKQYVIDFTTVQDTSGRPVVLIPFGDWDLRRKALEGKVVTELGKRLDYMEENSAQLAFNLTGDPTSFLITDLAGFSLRKHACVGCIPFYLNWVRHHEVHYPYNFYTVLCINTPGIFEPILNLMRPLMTASTRDAFKTMGYNREEWSKFIHQTVSPDQLPFRFGGNKKPKA